MRPPVRLTANNYLGPAEEDTPREGTAWYLRVLGVTGLPCDPGLFRSRTHETKRAGEGLPLAKEWVIRRPVQNHPNPHQRLRTNAIIMLSRFRQSYKLNFF